MGLRYASVRQPYVVVMAPALTETGQPQGFPLKSGKLSSPVSLITFSENTDSNLKYDIKCTRNLKFLDTSVGMNGDSENIAELKTVPPQSSPCNDNTKDKDILNKSCEFFDQNIPKESDYSLLQIGGFMMNSGYPSADDENMGLQKSSSQVTSMDSCNSYLKMDIFKTLGSNTQSDLGGGGDLGHNVEEIMQVIKNMESKGNDIEENLESSLQISDGNDIAGSLSTFEREFLNDVDNMMSMCVDENLGENNLSIVNRDTLIKDKIDEAQDRQFKIERKCEWLLRRLRKLQARAMGKQASEEITGMLQYVSNILTDSSSSTRSSPLYSALTSGKIENEKREISNSCVSTLVRRLDQSSQQQALAISQHHVPCKYFGSGSSEIATSNRQGYLALSGSILPKLNSDVRKEMDNVSGQLHFQLKVVETGLDSDVTASSSGGESCDELQSFNNLQQQNLSISKRSSWRWAQDRAAIASRWSWLQAQISDLEYRIRQNNDLNKQLRTGKGGVVLGGDDPPRLSDSVVVNGYHGALPGTTAKSVDDEIVYGSACRTRPLMRSSFRKRKLFRTSGLHLTSKKIAKASTVHCGCHPPLPSCVLCTGRPDPTQPHEDIDLLTLNERIALLDPAFHPVLSFFGDISQSLHFDAIMKNPDWQLKAQRNQVKTSSTLRILEPVEEAGTTEIVSKRPLLEQRRRYFKRSAVTALSDKIKKKLTKGKREPNNYALERLKTRRRFSSLKVPGAPAGGDDRGDQRHSGDENHTDTSPYMVVSGTSHPSPIPSPSPSPHCSKERGDGVRRKRENSYDIDNIVIPYSVAASTRLEKLQYKEILTPKWRVLPVDPLVKIDAKNNGLIRRNSQEEDSEDLAEDVLVSRHERCEQEEKKKFSTYLKLPNSMARARSHRRADSRAESSGGNTPDPMSPAAPDCAGSPMTSPPATPQPADADCNVRRRTASQSIGSRCVSPTDTLHDEVAPYDLRTFPLTDEIYEKMLRLMPPGHPFKAYSSSHLNSSRDSESESRPLDSSVGHNGVCRHLCGRGPK
ncbi:KAT8 regulatory NSL complex subunit 1 isoform X1 [Homalodisca vitripennis]|uniref:KAT8 regulatory NSL complex subunit 1 isoform X1 n=1 Tax=Homalodisca vitripennis TaxID=197043 RepID=UPI001EEC38C7|nr:KAT8 regulatory NSL complex subunit 1 isoform X1 [Homalodisca vitripennis]